MAATGWRGGPKIDKLVARIRILAFFLSVYSFKRLEEGKLKKDKKG